MGNKDIGNGTAAESYSTFWSEIERESFGLCYWEVLSGKERSQMFEIIREREKRSVVRSHGSLSSHSCFKFTSLPPPPRFNLVKEEFKLMHWIFLNASVWYIKSNFIYFSIVFVYSIILIWWVFWKFCNITKLLPTVESW